MHDNGWEINRFAGDRQLLRIEGGRGRVGLGGLEIACADESHFSFGRQIINFLLHHFNRLSVPDHRRPKLQL